MSVLTAVSLPVMLSMFNQTLTPVAVCVAMFTVIGVR